MLRAIILACTFFVGAQARIAPFGCPTVTPKPGVQYNRLTGKWFEYLRYFDSDRVFTKCASYDMTLQAVDTELEIETTVVKRLSEDTRSSTTSYTIGTSTEGILRPSDGPNLILLETDYTNYAVFYTCENLTFNLFRRDFLWVLVRSDSAIVFPLFFQVGSVLEENGISPPFFTSNVEQCEDLLS